MKAFFKFIAVLSIITMAGIICSLTYQVITHEEKINVQNNVISNLNARLQYLESKSAKPDNPAEISTQVLKIMKDYNQIEQKMQKPLSYLNNFPENKLPDEFRAEANNIINEYNKLFGSSAANTGDICLLKAGLDFAANNYQSANSNLCFVSSVLSSRLRGYALFKNGSFDESISHLNCAINANPDDYIALNILADCYKEKHKYEEMLSCSEKAIALSPDNYKAWDNKCFALSMLNISEGYKEGAAKLEKLKIIEDGKNIRELYGNRGDKEGVERLITLSKKIAENPSDDKNWEAKGNIIRCFGEYEPAIQCYDKAIEINPDNSGAWNERALVLSEKGDYDEAISSFDKALKLKPKNPAPIHHRKGCTLVKQKKYKEALECYDAAMKLEPDNIEIMNCKALSLNRTGETESALQLIDKAIKQCPEAALSYYNKACIYSLSKQKNNMLSNLKKAVELSPDYYRYLAGNDEDFKEYQNDNDFKNLLQKPQ